MHNDVDGIQFDDLRDRFPAIQPLSDFSELPHNITLKRSTDGVTAELSFETADFLLLLIDFRCRLSNILFTRTGHGQIVKRTCRNQFLLCCERLGPRGVEFLTGNRILSVQFLSATVTRFGMLAGVTGGFEPSLCLSQFFRPRACFEFREFMLQTRQLSASGCNLDRDGFRIELSERGPAWRFVGVS